MTPFGTTTETAALVARLRAAGCVYAEDEATLLIEAAEDAEHLERLTAQRVAGAPLETLLGWAAFRGLRIRVAPGVFVPRTRTEYVVEVALEDLRHGGVVLDLCCGAGAIGAAIAAVRPDATVYAADLDGTAVACARRNLPPERVYAGDLFDALPTVLRGSIDVIAVNAPYVPTAQIATMPREARDSEPLAALDGGADGLLVHRRIAERAAHWTRAGGRLVIETSSRQAEGTARLLELGGFETAVRHSVDHDATIAVGIRAPRPPGGGGGAPHRAASPAVE